MESMGLILGNSPSGIAWEKTRACGSAWPAKESIRERKFDLALLLTPPADG
jgi:hypothetical protein